MRSRLLSHKLLGGTCDVRQTVTTRQQGPIEAGCLDQRQISIRLQVPLQGWAKWASLHCWLCLCGPFC